uniref:Uncharacterized protein n=1 Tax=Micrurus carvalhoi TaxID=3147026 RepID=A0A2H6N272_9SAUR
MQLNACNCTQRSIHCTLASKEIYVFKGLDLLHIFFFFDIKAPHNINYKELRSHSVIIVNNKLKTRQNLKTKQRIKWWWERGVPLQRQYFCISSSGSSHNYMIMYVNLKYVCT